MTLNHITIGMSATNKVKLVTELMSHSILLSLVVAGCHLLVSLLRPWMPTCNVPLHCVLPGCFVQTELALEPLRTLSVIQSHMSLQRAFICKDLVALDALQHFQLGSGLCDGVLVVLDTVFVLSVRWLALVRDGCCWLVSVVGGAAGRAVPVLFRDSFTEPHTECVPTQTTAIAQKCQVIVIPVCAAAHFTRHFCKLVILHALFSRHDRQSVPSVHNCHRRDLSFTKWAVVLDLVQGNCSLKWCVPTQESVYSTWNHCATQS